MGVALLAFSTQSSYGPRVDWELISLGRRLRRGGTPCVLFQVHFDTADEVENARRIDELLSRIVSGGFSSVVCLEIWTPDLGRRLREAHLQVHEIRFHPESMRDVLDAVMPSVAARQPLDEYEGLVELVGVPPGASVANVDLTLGQACSYQATIDDNPFFAELAREPAFSGHRGCGHCLSGHRPDPRALAGSDLDVPDQLLDELRSRRALLPGLETVWMPFAEVFYDALSQAFDRSVGDPVWRDLTLSMQCRPDVIVQRRGDIEQLGRKAARAGTVVKIAVVGFENFSRPELQRMNRGVTPEQLSSAAAILAAWGSEPVPGLEVRGFIPSFILFGPWTSLEDLELNLREIERHGLTSANIERMRLASGTPLHEMARRAKLVGSSPVRLAVHPNGYFSETAYEFRDSRVAAASAGFDTLKPLAFEEQASLLAAVVDAVKRSSDPARIDWERMAATWHSIKERANGSAQSPRRTEPRPGRTNGSRGAAPRGSGRIALAVGPGCNNGCQPCVWARRLDIRARVSTAGEPSVAGKVVELAGREPTVANDLPGTVRRLREAGAVGVGVETNGRRLVYPAYVRALDAAGLDELTIKLFGTDAATWDAHTREPGSFAQTMQGMATLQQLAPGIELTAMIVPGRQAGSRLQELVAFAGSLGLSRVRAVLRMARQDLLALGELEAMVADLVAATDGPVVSIVAG